jgi:Leucine-rich repeat (LRR) protein
MIRVQYNDLIIKTFDTFDDFYNSNNKENIILFDCKNNNLTEIPNEIFTYLHKVRSFDCSHNKLINFPFKILSLSNLQFLMINDNKLKEIHKYIDRLYYLEYLYVNNNELTGLPIDICNLHYLKYLNCSYNKIENLPVYDNKFIYINKYQQLDFITYEYDNKPKKIILLDI